MSEQRLKNTRYVVEASSYEQQCLWAEHHKKIQWESDLSGIYKHIGEFGGERVFAHFSWASLDGILVLFWEATSNVVNYSLIEEWFKQNCDPWHQGRRAECDASNFRQALGAVEEMSKEKKDSC